MEPRVTFVGYPKLLEAMAHAAEATAIQLSWLRGDQAPDIGLSTPCCIGGQRVVYLSDVGTLC